MKRPANHTHYDLNWDGCAKCGMSATQYTDRPYRQCRPKLTKRVKQLRRWNRTADRLLARTAH